MLRGQATIPRGAVWISFDDGWRENIDNALPIILEHDIPVTFFIATDPVERSGVFWWSVVQKYAKHLPPPYYNNRKQLWKIREEERGRVIKELEQRFLKECIREAMTIEDIVYISNIPQITIGCHTVHHVIIPNCTESEMELEISQAKSVLEDWTGKPVKFFSYPNGDFDGRERGILKRYGFELSATSEKRFITANNDFYLVPRFSVPDNALFSEALCRMLGVFNPFVAMGRFLGMAP
jgi:peptidoglycan/xylan/chitin deacetylase (PgdA/CDA1 family)